MRHHMKRERMDGDWVLSPCLSLFLSLNSLSLSLHPRVLESRGHACRHLDPRPKAEFQPSLTDSLHTVIPAADTNACEINPCDSTGHATAGSCVDLPAPSMQYTCNCTAGYVWHQPGLDCVGKCCVQQQLLL